MILTIAYGREEGQSAQDIEGGRRLGMDGIVFKDALQYERELRELLK